MSNSAEKKIAVVILNWNGKKFLEQFLSGVVKHSGAQAHIVVADNASSDDSLAYLKANHPEVTVIPMKENTGFTGGYNRALEQLNEEYFVLLNSDIEVTPGWLDTMIQFMDQHPEVAACQPKILDYNKKEYFEYAGAAGGYVDRLGYPFCRGRIFQSLEKDQGQYDEPVPVFWATGACMMVRSKVYNELGGLDERFFAHMEEIDLCWRIKIAGYKIFVLPKSVIYHIGGGTLPKNNPRKTYLNFRNNLLLLHKNLNGKEFNSIYRYRFILDGLAAITFLFNSGFGDLKAVFKAHRDFWRMKQKNNKNHKNLPSGREIGLRSTSILYQYHLNGKKKYADLP